MPSAGTEKDIPPAIHIRFDLDNARQTLSLLSRKAITAAELDSWLSLPGTQALIRKVNAEPEAAKSALQKAIAGQELTAAEQHFQYGFIRERLPEMTAWIDLLEAKRDSIIQHLQTKLTPYVRPGTAASVTLYGLMGSYSGGFAFPADPSSFYLGLHFYPGDMPAIVETSEHELFHTLQSRAYAYEPVMERLRQVDTAYEAPYYLLRHLYLEGAAEYVADAKEQATASPGLKKEKDHAAVNHYRHKAVFYLLEHLLLDAYRHPGEMDFGQLYSILFDWNWNNPAYYAGKMMMTALVEEKGRDYIRQSMEQDAIYFIKDYIGLSRTKAGLYQFSDAFEEMVNKMAARL